MIMQIQDVKICENTAKAAFRGKFIALKLFTLEKKKSLKLKI